jgi:hypothetical protein
MREPLAALNSAEIKFFQQFWKWLISAAIGSMMTSFTNKPKANGAGNPGGFTALEVAGEDVSSNAAYGSNRLAGRSWGVESLVQPGEVAERSSQCRITSRPIGMSASSRGAVRSFRNFPDSKQIDVLIPGRSLPGGISFQRN